MTDAAPPKALDPQRFVAENTTIETTPLVPEICLRLASEVVPLWQATEDQLAEIGLPPPYWAFAWAGGQALARYLLDRPETVRGRRVLDFAAGSGLVAIAAAKAGAARVEASEIDRFALQAIALNAQMNAVAVTVLAEDVLADTGGPTAERRWDVVLAGDVCYERPMAEKVFAFLRAQARAGVLVLLGDPGRAYLPKAGLQRLTAYAVQTTRELEDSDVRNAVVWQVAS